MERMERELVMQLAKAELLKRDKCSCSYLCAMCECCKMIVEEGT